MQQNISRKSVLKYIFFPLLLLSFFSFQRNTYTALKAAPTVITTKQSETYINNYYSSINTSLTGNSLAGALESLLKAERKNSFSYKSLEDTAFPYTDVDPTRPHDGYIVSFYSGTAVKGYSGMNKEHTWPNSHGGNKIENDPHMVRPTISAENSSRGNEYFSNTAAGWDPASLGDVTARGMSARIILYGAVIGKASGLILEDIGRGQGSGTKNKMGKLGDLLKWNLEYPVNQKEIIRNETLDSSLNYNRNPFIDRPEYACAIWGETNANTRNICASATPVEVTGISVTPTNSTINLLGSEKGVQLNAAILPSNATNKNVTWTSTNTSVATVSSSGYVSAKAVGSTTILVTSSANPAKVAQAHIEVVSEDIAVTGITLNKTTTSLSVGKSETLIHTILPSGATNKNVTWASMNPSIASVNSGEITAHSEGTTTISATTLDGGFKAYVNVTVTEAVTSSVISASFYNKTGNSGGVSPTAQLMNNKGSDYLGFNGLSVIKTVDATQGYLPRGGGLAIGSGKNAGSLKITLNDDYKTSKISVLFNNAGVTSVPSLKGPTGVSATTTNGTIGTTNSNPSSGTPYTIEFNSEQTYFEIHATLRIAIVEINITIGDTTTPTPSAYEKALAWSTSFLSLTSEGCNTSDRALLQTAWYTAEDNFVALSGEAQTLIIDALPVYSENDVISHAKARYVVILNEYNFADFINNEMYLNSVYEQSNTLNLGFTLFFGITMIISFAFYTLRLKTKV